MSYKLTYTEDKILSFDKQEKKETFSSIIPGFYRIESKDVMLSSIRFLKLLDKKEINLPLLHNEIRDTHMDTQYIMNYFSEKSLKIHSEIKAKRKMGIILHGKQGTGKTTSCLSICQKLVDEYNAAVVFVRSKHDLDYVINISRAIKEDINDFLLVIMFDECEYVLSHNESTVKGYLDGPDSLNNFMFIGTTNYIKDIPDSIKDRPSRIKFCNKIEGIKEEDIVFSILKSMNKELGLEESILRNIVPNLVNCTLDEIKNKFVDQILQIRFKEAFEVKNEVLEESESLL